MRGDEVPTHSRGDLRGQAKDRKRVVDSKTKWQPKWAYGGIPHIMPGPNGTERPNMAFHSQNCARQDRKVNAKPQRRAARLNKQDLGSVGNPKTRKQEVAVVDGALDLSVAEQNDSSDASSLNAAANDDADYYLDSANSSPHGEAILENAITQAVLKFEDRKTRELVRDEYDILDEASDTEPDGLAEGKSSVDDDFELL